jgi:ABC-2 type transport system ATP-binding protein
VLDEPTSGLDPIVRREFIETVIGAYQSGDPDRRTVFVSTHLIAEFEGLIDEFAIIAQGRNLLTMDADHGLILALVELGPPTLLWLFY